AVVLHLIISADTAYAPLSYTTLFRSYFRFQPRLTGIRSSVLAFSNALNIRLSLTGTGVAPHWPATPNSLDFGSQLASTTSSEQRITVNNNEPQALTLGQLSHLHGSNE